jgi:hypothetical protein
VPPPAPPVSVGGFAVTELPPQPVRAIDDDTHMAIIVI